MTKDTKRNQPPSSERPLQLALLDMIAGPQEAASPEPSDPRSAPPVLSPEAPGQPGGPEAPAPDPEPERQRSMPPQGPARGLPEALVDTEPDTASPAAVRPSVRSPKPVPQDDQPAQTAPTVLTVTQLLSGINRELSRRFTGIWLEGELGRISFRRNIYYMSLKDDKSLVEAVLMTWKCNPSFPLTDGLKVRVRGYVDIFAPRGKLSFQIEHIEPLGAGALSLAFEQLKKKLQAEGLFDDIHKKPIPAFPRRVGVVTSTESAAFRDILKVAAQRVGTRIIAANALVQGRDAPVSIMSALSALVNFGDLDCIVIARGGGSAEDLAGFNDEALVRAIFACPIPVVTGVGHQIDFTLADFVADYRAATPTSAAELVFLERRHLDSALREMRTRLAKAVVHKLQEQRHQLLLQSGRLVHPQAYLDRRGRELDALAMSLERMTLRTLEKERRRLERASESLDGQEILARIARGFRTEQRLRERMLELVREKLHQSKEQLITHASTLSALSPLAVLERGYAVVTDESGRALRSTRGVEPGERIAVRLHAGGLSAKVEEIRE
ncbi:exodeoxyribonuclease VII large subunit [Myxococcota bacterium]|nr:exodeoxyribonuclease VII large subunit [Myxococcota bacterium]MBU1534843.1 exodeoxyribonuclease VII large subunit [Myxococcota bacterium]